MGGSGPEDSVIWTPRSEIQHALESRPPRKAVRDFFVQTPSRSRRRHRNAQIVFDDSGVSLGSPTEGCRANSVHIRPSTSWQNAIILGGKTLRLITTLLARDFLKDRQSPIAQNVQEVESTLDDKNRSKDSIYDAHR